MAASAARPCSAAAGRARPNRSRSGPSTSSPSTAAVVGDLQYETDRGRFLGRGRTPADPAALDPGAALSGTTGAVLDPIFSLRRRVRLEAGGVGARGLHHGRGRHARRGAGPGRPVPRVQRRHARLRAGLGAQPGRAAAPAPVGRGGPPVSAAGRRTSSSPAPRLRAAPDVLAANRQGQPGLWRHGISGDRPIVLVRIGEADELALVRQLLAAHAYWRLKGLEVDLVMLNEDPAGYLEELQQRVAEPGPGQRRPRPDRQAGRRLRAQGGADVRGRPHPAAGGGPRRPGRRPRLAGDASSTASNGAAAPARPPIARARAADELDTEPSGPRAEDLLFANGLGGFTPDGREYCHLGARPSRGRPPQRHAEYVSRRRARACRRRPGSTSSPTRRSASWSPRRGGGYTWAGNSQSNRLTPWSNDPVSDPPGEVVYLRDEETGEVWTPTAAAVRAGRRRTPSATARATPSSSRTPQRPRPRADCCSSPPDDPVKLIRLKVAQHRRPAAPAVGDVLRRVGAGHDPRRRRRCTSSPRSTPRPGRCWRATPSTPTSPADVAFADVNARPRTLTADRTEFLGRNGGLAAPAAPGARGAVAARVGAGPRPVRRPAGRRSSCSPARRRRSSSCSARPTTSRRPAGWSAATASRAGRGRRSRRSRIAGTAFSATVQVRTPDPALDLLLNRWLLVPGAELPLLGPVGVLPVGRRLRLPRPAPGRAWPWSTPRRRRRARTSCGRRRGSSSKATCSTGGTRRAGRGVRTRFSDDFLWLPFVVAHYVDGHRRRGRPRRAGRRSSRRPC